MSRARTPWWLDDEEPVEPTDETPILKPCGVWPLGLGDAETEHLIAQMADQAAREILGDAAVDRAMRLAALAEAQLEDDAADDNAMDRQTDYYRRTF